MNLSVDNTTVAGSATSTVSFRPQKAWPVIIGLAVLALAQSGLTARSGSIMMVIVGQLIAYPLAVYLYKSIASRAFAGDILRLLGLAAAATIIGGLLSPSEQIIMTMANIAMVPAAAILVGWKARTETNRIRLYIWGGLLVLLVSLVAFAPLWGRMTEMWEMFGQSAVEDVKQNMLLLGYHADTVEEYGLQVAQILKAILRLIPVATILNPIALYSVGFLWFLQNGLPGSANIGRPEPFERWKVPFGLAPVLIVVAAGRLLGGATLQLVADNMLLMLSLFYLIGGLALIQGVLKKLALPVVLRIMFYVMMFLTGLIGYTLSVLLGFIDSFADWRKVGPNAIGLDKK